MDIGYIRGYTDRGNFISQFVHPEGGKGIEKIVWNGYCYFSQLHFKSF